MTNTKDSVLFSIDVEDSFKELFNRVQNVNGALEDIKKNTEAISSISNRDAIRAMSDLESQVVSLKDEVAEAAAMSDFTHVYNGNAKAADTILKKINVLRKAQEDFLSSSMAGNDEQAKAARKRYSDTYALIEKERKMVASAMKDKAKRIKDVFIDEPKNIRESIRSLPASLGSSLGASLRSAMQGDLHGTLGSLGEAGGSLAKTGGSLVKNKAKGSMLKSELSGGIAGAPPIKGLGKIGKALGSAAKALGPMMAAVGGLALVVKLLIDADEQTKDLNKAMFEQIPYYTLAADGMASANEKLVQMRESATDFATNMRLGLDPKQHYEVISAIVEQGGALRTLESQYENFGALAKDVVETVRVASLNLGSSLGEVAGFVAQMQDMHASTLQDIKDDLQSIVGFAAQSGVSTKRFFGVITQLAGAMNLYNYKIEETAFFLGEMHKIMDSKSAEEFTTRMTSGLKDMNFQQRAQTMILAGEVTLRKMVRKESATMFKALKTDFGGLQLLFRETFGDKFGVAPSSMKGLQKSLMKLGSKDRNVFLAKVQNDMGEETSRKLGEAIRMSSAAQKGGLALVDAMTNLGALDNVQLQVMGLENVFKKPIEDLTSMEAESLNVNLDQLRQLQRYATITKGQYGIFTQAIKGLQDQDATGAEIGAAVSKLADQYGYALKWSADQNAMVNEAGEVVSNSYDLLGSLKDSQKKQIDKNASLQKTSAEKQIEATQSLGAIFTHLMTDLLNSVGGYLSVISSFVSDIADKMGVRTDRQIARSKAADEVTEARATLTRLRRKRRKARGSTPDLDASLAKAEARFESAEAAQNALLDNDSAFFDSKGAARGSIGAMTDEARLANKLGYEGDFSKFQTQSKDFKSQMGQPGKRGNWYFDAMEAWVSGQKLGKNWDEIQAETFELQKTQGDKGLSLAETTNQILEKRGIKLDAPTLKGIQASMEIAYKNALAAEALMSEGGFSRSTADQIIGARASGKTVTEADLKSFGVDKVTARMRASLLGGATAGSRTLTPAGDARILSSGFAPLAFTKGDFVIKASEIAKTKSGTPGSMIPSLDKAMGFRKGSGSSRPGNVTFNITINGGQPGQVEREIRRVYETIRREERSGGGS